MHQPFEAVMEVSGVKTRYSEQTMLRVEADILLVTESSVEEDSETDDQSYFPPEVYAQTWQGYITHVLHVVLHSLLGKTLVVAQVLRLSAARALVLPIRRYS